jgi:hypothetical protein
VKKFITPEISLVLGYVFAIHIFEALILPSLLVPAQILSGFSLTERFFNIWTTNADTFHYMLAAKEGYPTANPAFFPMMPVLLKITGANPVSAKILSIALFVVFVLTFKKIIELFNYSKYTQLILFSFLAFPATFLLVAPFSETLYLPASALAIYFAEKDKFTKSAVFVAIASATRLIGVVLVFYLFLKIVQKRKKQFLKFAPNLLIAPLGIILFAVFLEIKTGDFSQLYAGHKEWGRGITASNLASFFSVSKELIFQIAGPTKPHALNLIHFGSIFFAAALSAIAFRKISLPLWTYCNLALIIPLISGTYFGMPRYILAVFPLFIPFGKILENNKILMYLYFFLAIILQTFLILRFFNFEAAA